MTQEQIDELIADLERPLTDDDLLTDVDIELRKVNEENTTLRAEVEKLRATAREYIEAHKLMRTRFQDANDAETYTAAAKRLEELVDG